MTIFGACGAVFAVVAWMWAWHEAHKAAKGTLSVADRAMGLNERLTAERDVLIAALNEIAEGSDNPAQRAVDALNEVYGRTGP